MLWKLLKHLTSLFNKQKETSQLTPSTTGEENSVVREEINLGQHKLELEAAGKSPPRYTLAKGPDGGLNLVPIVNDNSGGGGYEFMQPKGYEEKGRSRQQMQLTTLVIVLFLNINTNNLLLPCCCFCLFLICFIVDYCMAKLVYLYLPGSWENVYDHVSYW